MSEPSRVTVADMLAVLPNVPLRCATDVQPAGVCGAPASVAAEPVVSAVCRRCGAEPGPAYSCEEHKVGWAVGGGWVCPRCAAMRLSVRWELRPLNEGDLPSGLEALTERLADGSEWNGYVRVNA